MKVNIPIIEINETEYQVKVIEHPTEDSCSDCDMCEECILRPSLSVVCFRLQEQLRLQNENEELQIQLVRK